MPAPQPLHHNPCATLHFFEPPCATAICSFELLNNVPFRNCSRKPLTAHSIEDVMSNTTPPRSPDFDRFDARNKRSESDKALKDLTVPARWPSIPKRYKTQANCLGRLAIHETISTADRVQSWATLIRALALRKAMVSSLLGGFPLKNGFIPDGKDTGFYLIEPFNDASFTAYDNVGATGFAYNEDAPVCTYLNTVGLKCYNVKISQFILTPRLKLK
ncbi:hypothetical protein QBC46DRAFT_457726 [Diplogelasinospora grovesii]|uniref:Uncharacterized protein n=1 Tax=Diplogelasinospora grovesii TaxID=303347 RepID=A0AAN6ND95_9PEZI|nr:hypothetical protein QBC46DRAFT_457726 [Diplogelasinospora grovesii]